MSSNRECAKVIIFGTGKYYQKNKYNFREDIQIVGFLDNNSSLSKLDDIPVYKPEEIHKLEFDYIFLLSVYEKEMQKQLIELNVPMYKICGMDRKEMLCKVSSANYYGKCIPDTAKKKLLVFSHALTSTGAQNVLFTTLSILKEYYEITVVSKSDGVLKERLNAIDIGVVIMSDLTRGGKELQKLVEWSDEILVNTIWLYYVIVELSDCNKRILWWLHESGAIPEIGKETFYYINGLGNVDIYVVSNVVKKVLQKECKNLNNIEVFKFGIKEYEIKESQQKEKIVFSIISAIGHIKGQDIFIEAVSRLPDYYRKQAEFWIVGRGTLPEEQLKMAEKYSCIKILGEIDNRKMNDVYAQLDVVVCCSREEAMSVVVIEGFMNRKITIVSEAAGVAEFVEDGKNGFILKYENVEQLCELIRYIIANPKEAAKVGDASREIYDSHFSMEIFKDRIKQVFNYL